MQTKIIEAQDSSHSLWGRFLVGRFDNEWSRCSRSAVMGFDSLPVLSGMGWNQRHLLVMDLSVGHGALFDLADSGPVDFEHRGVYFGPLFKDFMTWLYAQDTSDLDGLPDELELERPTTTAPSRDLGT